MGWRTFRGLLESRSNRENRVIGVRISANAPLNDRMSEAAPSPCGIALGNPNLKVLPAIAFCAVLHPLVAFGAPGNQAQGGKKQADETRVLAEKAREHSREYEFASALEIYSRILKKDGSPQLRMRAGIEAGDCYYKMGEFEKAAEMFGRIRDFAQSGERGESVLLARARKRRLFSLLEGGKFEAAVSHVKDVARQEGLPADAMNEYLREKLSLIEAWKKSLPDRQQVRNLTRQALAVLYSRDPHRLLRLLGANFSEAKRGRIEAQLSSQPKQGMEIRAIELTMSPGSSRAKVHAVVSVSAPGATPPNSVRHFFFQFEKEKRWVVSDF